jgi:hypothetical protein
MLYVIRQLPDRGPIFNRNPPGCASFGRLSRGRGIAHRSKTTAGILPLNASPARTFAHQPKYAAAPLPQLLTWCTG